MSKKMLIDATHAEETRVVVIEGNKVDEFDFETITRRQLAGNIYLAKVTRVEPSLQAAFVDYGGNRHGFLAFSEIHPDYYQIPLEDRKKLLEEEAELERRDQEEQDAEEKPAKPKRRRRKAAKDEAPEAEASDADTAEAETGDAPGEITDADTATAEAAPDQEPEDAPTDAAENDAPAKKPRRRVRKPKTQAEATGIPANDDDDVVVSDDVDDDEPLLVDTPENKDDKEAEKPKRRRRSAKKDKDDKAEDTSADADEGTKAKKTRRRRKKDEPDEAPEGEASEAIESVAAEAVEEEVVRKKPRPRRFKIQEVIRVRQILLVQVVKEERGNKGAALTTYLSLAGRYCVLMPNTARGGGISRKITNPADRKKLKDIASDIEVPEGAGLIIRTAGSRRTKTEIKRDYEYLLRLWEQIRDLTLNSIAPKLIYEEGNLIKRSIRDLYNRDIDEVIVAGDQGHKEAKEYMKMLLPSHAKNVKSYDDTMPLFSRYQVENYLGGMMNPTVQLRSGGYIVINVTEALVAVDVNSGRATKEGSIEETALKTNLEAAEEVARQMRLRDLAGLIVIDFIDMEERRNNTAVEKKLKDALKNDRARVQVGRISGFGLLEMSRQRLRPGMLEATTSQCPHCYGTGYIRSDENLALAILRELDEEGMRQRSREVLVRVPINIANYMLNAKREHVGLIEARYGLSVRIEADPSLVGSQYNVERFKNATRNVVKKENGPAAITADATHFADPVEEPEKDEETEGEGERKGRRRRRRGRGRGRNKGEAKATDASVAEDSETGAEAPDAGDSATDEADAEKPAKKRTRKPRAKKTETGEAETGEAPAAEATPAPEPEAAPEPAPEPETEAPAPDTEPQAQAEASAPDPEPEAPAAADPEPEPEPAKAEPEAQTEPEPEPDPAPKKPRRSGWWARAVGK